MEQLKTLSIVYPAYNEEGIIENVIKDTAKALQNILLNWEIIIVNDGSTDNTLPILENLNKIESRIIPITHLSNKGYASATKTGINSAKGDIIIIIDSDGQQEPKDIPDFISKINSGYDIVVGWKKNRQDSLLRIFLSKVYNFIFRYFFKLPLHDVDCGFRALKKDAAKSIKIQDGSIIVGTQMFVQAKKMNIKITEIPVRHYPRKTGDTIFKLWKMPQMVSSILFELCKMKIEYIKWEKMKGKR